jgi:hypothetical protein
MFESSPIITWKGAGVICIYASSGAMVWFWVSVALCIAPLMVSLAAESAANAEHK